MELKMYKLDLDGDFFGENPDATFEKDNLLELGLSEELATALDERSIGEFKEILVNNIQSGQDVNLEMLRFGKELFASYQNTGYEDNQVNAVITALEEKVENSRRGVQGLVHSYDEPLFSFAEKDGKSAPLPTELQPEQETEVTPSNYQRLAVKEVLGI